MLVFLGPGAYVGSDGGGDEITIAPDAKGNFSVKYTIPATYSSGGFPHHTNPVLPGDSYEIGSYPADVCSVGFRVTAGSG